MTVRRGLPLLAVLGLLLVGMAAAEARPGGGHSYSGSSHSSSSSHSSGGGSRSSSSRSSGSRSSSSSSGGSVSFSGSGSDFIIIILGGAAALLVHALRSMSQEQDSHADFTPMLSPPPAAPRRRPAQVFDALRRHDPEFSAVLFEDFVYALYARLHGARSDPDALAALAPYIADEARAALARREPRGAAIHGVVIGRMEVVSLVHTGEFVSVELAFESNYTAEFPDGPRGFYVHERWTLTRHASARTRPPGAVLGFQCPACGAPYERSDAGACSHCGQAVENGRFDWRVRAVHLREQEPRPPALTGDVAEQGTGLPTVSDHDLRKQYAALIAEDPDTRPHHIERRMHDIYHALNDAWTARDLRPVRPHVSDALFIYLTYWIDAYRAQGLRNELKDMEISRMQVVKVTRDHHFDAVTVRFWATGFDSTVNANNRLVSGSSRHKRAYSEYWTLIRGAAVRGAPRDPASCPSCGAALDRVSMAGNCEYCGSHLTRGEFDWVLSKIEQDESYTG